MKIMKSLFMVLQALYTIWVLDSSVMISNEFKLIVTISSDFLAKFQKWNEFTELCGKDFLKLLEENVFARAWFEPEMDSPNF